MAHRPSMHKKTIVISLVSLCACILTGCAGIEAPNPDEMIRKPFGDSSIKAGMTKPQVESLWGKPARITTETDKERWDGERQVWIYPADFAAVPVSVDYLSKTRKVYFDGENVTNVD